MSMCIISGVYPDTPASRFAKARLSQLLEKISAVGNHLEGNGVPEAWFQAMPDFSPSLNDMRMAEGLPVGGVLGWNTGETDFVPAAVPSNGCGVLVAEVFDPLPAMRLIANIRALIAAPPSIGGRRLIWDAGHKNHFLNVYSGPDGSTYLILHCSLPEYKSDAFSNIPVKVVDTPFGPLRCYHGDAADAYRVAARHVEEMAQRKREIIRLHVAPRSTTIFNENHVRLVSRTAAAVGCYASQSPILRAPLTVGPGKQAFLISTRRPTATPAGELFLQPHGTGNSMSRPGDVAYDEKFRLLLVKRPEQAVYDTPADVFDTYPDISEMADSFVSWFGSNSGMLTLTPLIETKLREAN